MDFKEIKKKALEIKQKAQEKWKEAIDYSAQKLASSRFTISTKEDLTSFIAKSANTKAVQKETGKQKTFSHRVIIIVWEEKSDFFQKSLYELPVIATKGFTQNTPVKLAKSKIPWIDWKKYSVTKVPGIIVFENKKVLKSISGKQNVTKLVKSLELDINKTIDTL